MQDIQIQSIIDVLVSGGVVYKNMHRQSPITLYLYQTLFVSVLVIICIIFASIIITSLGSNTVLAANSTLPSSSETIGSDDPNVIVGLGSSIMGSARNLGISIGTNLYAASERVKSSATLTGMFFAHGSVIVMGGTLRGMSFVGSGLGKVIALPFKLPIKVAESIGHTHPLELIIRPADSKKAPIIDGQTSASVLAHYNAEQQKQILNLLESQKTANINLGGSITAGDPKHGGYPVKYSNTAQDSIVDKWGMYNRECVSYAAWKVYQTYGFMPNWGGVGNANQWVGDAQAAGIRTGSKPKIHSVAISLRGYYGHAMWVEAVNGKLIYISQYNYDLSGHYSEMWVDGSNFTYLYFK